MKDRIWSFLTRYFNGSPEWRRLENHMAMSSPVVASKIYPHSDSDVWWTNNAPTTPTGLAPDQMPVPPPHLWEGYGREPAQYLGSGKTHVTKMLELLARDGVPIERTKRVLEFGSSTGRMLRWLTPYAEGRELWGVDIGSEAIHWAQMHLAPLNFACNSTDPHLPFEEGTFDLIYAGSVFSHIADLADTWLLELRRILAPGGVMYLTVHDKLSLKLLLDVHQTKLARWMREEEKKHGLSRMNFAKLVIARTPKGDQVFYDSEWLSKHWGRWLDVLSVNHEAYGYQTALILRKRTS